VPYLPHYYLGVCLLEQQDYVGATEAFNSRSSRARSARRSWMDDLVKRRGTAQAAEAASRARRARGEVMRCWRTRAELGKKGAWDESLPELAKAEALARSLDAETLRAVQQEQQRQRTAQAEARDQAARAQRLEQRLADGDRLLEEGKQRGQGRVRRGARPRARNARARGAPPGRGAHPGYDHARRAPAEAGEGKALFDGGQYEAALAPLSDAAADPTNLEAKDLLARARQALERLRLQRELRAEIDQRAARAPGALERGPLPRSAGGAAVAAAARRQPPARARAAGRGGAAHRRGDRRALAAQPAAALALFDRAGPVLETPTLSLQGAASDDQGVQKVEFRVGDRKVGEFLPASTPLQPARMVPFATQLALEPGENSIVVTAIDTGRASRTRCPSRSSGGCASTRPATSSVGRGRRLSVIGLGFAGRCCGAAAARRAASTPTSPGRRCSTTTCSTGARSSRRAC
jgi:hypothetical protein